MDLTKKGWLKKYMELREKQFHDAKGIIQEVKGNHPDEALYAVIQPTGIMYGYPIPGEFGIEGELDHLSRTKLLLMNALLGSYRLIKDPQMRIADPSQLFEEGVADIADFYNSVYKELYTKPTNLFGKRRSDHDLLEKILDKRIDHRFGKDNFWTGFFHNSLLFLDIYFFRQWVQTPDDKHVTAFLKTRKDDLRLDIVKVMAAAAHANENIEAEERSLFEFFINSLNMPQEELATARKYFEDGVSLDELPLQEADSWILRKFLFELAILTTWADQQIEESEERFLKEFNSRLNFSQDDFDRSMLAVEGFVLEYWQELDKLREKSDFASVSQQYKDRLGSLIALHRDRLYKEIVKRGTLIKMVQKAKAGKASEQEKEFIREQLVKCMQVLPVFQVIKLPDRYLSLNILMEILPEDFFKQVN